MQYTTTCTTTRTTILTHQNTHHNTHHNTHTCEHGDHGAAAVDFDTADTSVVGAGHRVRGSGRGSVGRSVLGVLTVR